MLKILLTGGKGMLGRTLAQEFDEFEVISTDLPECDITDSESVQKTLDHYAPGVVIHCAAMTQVDECENDSDNAFVINVLGTESVVRACKERNIRLIAISTDYVFGGRHNLPYTEYDQPQPRTMYGKTKHIAEAFIKEIDPSAVIARTAWLYGAGGPSFLHTMLKLADGTRPELKVVDDQLGNPTSCLAVARGLREIIKRPEITGIIHLSCEGEASWYDFAVEIFRQSGISQKVVRCDTSEFPRPAVRPANSRLAKLRIKELGLPPMPDWHDALAEFLSREI